MGDTRVAPATVSGNHHHGESETAIYVWKGHPESVFHDGRRDVRVWTNPGDYVFVPPYVPHREENPNPHETAEIVNRAKHAGTHRGESGLSGRAVAVGHRAPVRGRRRRRPRLETDHPRRFRPRFPSLRLRHSRRHRTSVPGVCVAYSAEVSGVGHEGCSSHTNTTLPSLPVLLWVRLTTSFQSSRRTVRSTRALSVPSATSANRSR